MFNSDRNAIDLSKIKRFNEDNLYDIYLTNELKNSYSNNLNIINKLFNPDVQDNIFLLVLDSNKLKFIFSLNDTTIPPIKSKPFVAGKIMRVIYESISKGFSDTGYIYYKIIFYNEDAKIVVYNNDQCISYEYMPDYLDSFAKNHNVDISPGSIKSYNESHDVKYHDISNNLYLYIKFHEKNDNDLVVNWFNDQRNLLIYPKNNNHDIYSKDIASAELEYHYCSVEYNNALYTMNLIKYVIEKSNIKITEPLILSVNPTEYTDTDFENVTEINSLSLNESYKFLSKHIDQIQDFIICNIIYNKISKKLPELESNFNLAKSDLDRVYEHKAIDYRTLPKHDLRIINNTIKTTNDILNKYKINIKTQRVNNLYIDNIINNSSDYVKKKYFDIIYITPYFDIMHSTLYYLYLIPSDNIFNFMNNLVNTQQIYNYNKENYDKIQLKDWIEINLNMFYNYIHHTSNLNTFVNLTVRIENLKVFYSSFLDHRPMGKTKLIRLITSVNNEKYNETIDYLSNFDPISYDYLDYIISELNNTIQNMTAFNYNDNYDNYNIYKSIKNYIDKNSLIRYICTEDIDTYIKEDNYISESDYYRIYEFIKLVDNNYIKYEDIDKYFINTVIKDEKMMNFCYTKHAFFGYLDEKYKYHILYDKFDEVWHREYDKIYNNVTLKILESDYKNNPSKIVKIMSENLDLFYDVKIPNNDNALKDLELNFKHLLKFIDKDEIAKSYLEIDIINFKEFLISYIVFLEFRREFLIKNIYKTEIVITNQEIYNKMRSNNYSYNIIGLMLNHLNSSILFHEPEIYKNIYKTVNEYKSTVGHNLNYDIIKQNISNSYYNDYMENSKILSDKLFVNHCKN